MTISCINIDELNQLDLHDAIFTGYHYDYRQRAICLSCIHPLDGTTIKISFENVILSCLQSCSFWHGGSNIFSFSLDVDYLSELDQLRSDNIEHIAGSFLECDVGYLPIKLVFNSGDSLQIICERVECII